jgi:hypothetical protein
VWKTSSSEATCQQGHYVCDACHSSSANDLIENVCIRSGSAAPVELAISLMNAPSVAIHVPEHYFLVPPVLLTVFYNQQNAAKEKS